MDALAKGHQYEVGSGKDDAGNVSAPGYLDFQKRLVRDCVFEF